MSEQCNRCRFWLESAPSRDPNDADFAFGDCRRHPPRLISPMVIAQMPRPEYGQQIDPEMDAVARQVASPFPATFATDWCGEYRAVTA